MDEEVKIESNVGSVGGDVDELLSITSGASNIPPITPEVPEVPEATESPEVPESPEVSATPDIIKLEDGSYQMTAKVNGEDQVMKMTPEQLLDRARKGETFYQNQEKLAADKKVLDELASRVGGYTPDVLAQVDMINRMKSENPQAFNELQFNLNKSLIGGDKPPTPEVDTEFEDVINKIENFSPEDKDSGDITKLIAQALRVGQGKQTGDAELLKQIAELKGRLDSKDADSKRDIESAQAEKSKVEMGKVRQLLVDNNVDREIVARKTEAFNKLYFSGMDAMVAAKIIFEHDLTKGKVINNLGGENREDSAKAYQPISPSTKVAQNTGKGESHEDQVSMALFGQKIGQNFQQEFRS